MAKLKALIIERDMRRGRYADGDGLYLLVGPSGAKSWIFRYQVQRRERAMGLGPFPTVTLIKAREAARECRRLRAAGLDPIVQREKDRAQRKLEVARTVTFKQSADQCIAARGPGWRNSKHAKQWSKTLETYVYPIIGDLPVGDVDRGLVLRVLVQDVKATARSKAGQLWNTRPETASRVRGRIEAVLDWAKVSGQREGDNPAVWRGNLSLALPKRSKVRKVKHHPALPFADAPAFLAELRQRPATAAIELEFLIYTAARTAEARNARWSEIDEAKAVWTIPADRRRSGRYRLIV